MWQVVSAQGKRTRRQDETRRACWGWAGAGAARGCSPSWRQEDKPPGEGDAEQTWRRDGHLREGRSRQPEDQLPGPQVRSVPGMLGEKWRVVRGEGQGTLGAMETHRRTLVFVRHEMGSHRRVLSRRVTCSITLLWMLCGEWDVDGQG